jgi:hypothetical protein
MPQLLSRLTATIANGNYISDAILTNGHDVSIIEMPSAWTAAPLTFQSSYDGTNYFNVYDNAGNEIYVIVDITRRIHIDIPELSQVKFIKLRSGTNVTVVTQGAERKIYVELWV